MLPLIIARTDLAAETDSLRIQCVRISNFRSLKNVEVDLGDLTVLIGANNAGKSTFLDALHLALGFGRRVVGVEDIFLESAESLPPKERSVTVDVLIRPVDATGAVIENFPTGSFWTELWGSGISQDDDFRDFMAFRTTLQWDIGKSEYSLKKHFLKEWLDITKWLDSEAKDEHIVGRQIEPITMYYIDAQRDLEEDLRRPGSFWRRLTDDLGLDEKDVNAIEGALSDINQALVDKSKVLKHLRENLSTLTTVVAGETAAVDISPVARRLRDLSKGVDVSFASSGSQAFPLTRHGMGTRSLASLMVFRAFVGWKALQGESEDERLHAVLALEEPEAHLHPQAQRALYAQIKSIPGQRLVSTHSPYFAGQADLTALRLFRKSGSESIVRALDLTSIDEDQKRQIERMVVATRGDLLFSRAVLLFEGETEEQAIPIFAREYWSASVHELGFNCIGIGGGHYFPFVWLADSLGIKFFIHSDGEPQPVKVLFAALKKAGIAEPDKDPRIVVLKDGRDFEAQLLHEGYEKEIDQAISQVLGATKVEDYIKDLDGKAGKKGVIRKYSGEGGRGRAILDIFSDNKTAIAAPFAEILVNLKDKKRRIPSSVRELFQRVDGTFGMKPAEESK